MSVGQSLRRAVGYFGSTQDDYDEYDDVYEPTSLPNDDRPPRALRLVDKREYDFYLACPHVFDDVQLIADNLKSEVPVLVDLHGCDAAQMERVVDFLRGVTYALDGNIYRVGERILLAAPKRIEFSSEAGAEALLHRTFG